MVGLKNGHIRKNLTQKAVNPRDIAGERKKKKKKKKKKIKVQGSNSSVGSVLVSLSCKTQSHGFDSPLSLR